MIVDETIYCASVDSDVCYDINFYDRAVDEQISECSGRVWGLLESN